MNFALMPLLFAALAAALAKAAWPRRLASSGWLRLASGGTAGALAAQVAGVAFSGRDGAIAVYLAMLAGCAAGLAWAGRGALLRS
ncbi:MAG TPA: hypothetical protein VFR90_04435 [Methylibium sp.]|nr:hypothetical protein [Methylibium sp.]